MDSIQETPTRFCRFLDESYFTELHRAFLHAFSDYTIEFDLTTEQFRNHIGLNAVDLASSVGWMEEDRLVGFTLNGFGNWHGVPTVYDAGTGVFPEFRRQGISLKMFEMMMPLFASKGYRQCLLEVITTNVKAINLYLRLGFKQTRKLSLLNCQSAAEFSVDLPTGNIEIREIGDADWSLLRTFWDGEPSWQNTTDAIDRSRDKKCFLGAFSRGECIGYLVFSANVGRISQMAVHPKHRRLGIGNVLLKTMIEKMSSDHFPQVINIDTSIESAMTFFTNRGFTERLSQYEMLCPL
ncbi:MAG: GNAT family N-acetyltransferase [Acidobacteriota bacterium]